MKRFPISLILLALTALTANALPRPPGHKTQPPHQPNVPDVVKPDPIPDPMHGPQPEPDPPEPIPFGPEPDLGPGPEPLSRPPNPAVVHHAGLSRKHPAPLEDGEQRGRSGSTSRVKERGAGKNSKINPAPFLRLANPGPQYNYVGDVVALRLKAADDYGHALWFSSEGGWLPSGDRGWLPSGLTIDPLTGVISGTILPQSSEDGGDGGGDGGPDPIRYSVTVTVTDAAAGASTSQTFIWDVQQESRPSQGNDGPAVQFPNPPSPVRLK
jgi:hypothetical protein